MVSFITEVHSLTFNVLDTHSELRGQVQEQLDSIRMVQRPAKPASARPSQQVEPAKNAPSANTCVFVPLLTYLFNLVSVGYQ